VRRGHRRASRCRKRSPRGFLPTRILLDVFACSHDGRFPALSRSDERITLSRKEKQKLIGNDIDRNQAAPTWLEGFRSAWSRACVPREKSGNQLRRKARVLPLRGDSHSRFNQPFAGECFIASFVLSRRLESCHLNHSRFALDYRQFSLDHFVRVVPRGSN
jgi:hypothetical protein